MPTSSSNIIIAGISTGVGKTLASALIALSLKADYWKPIQTGPDCESDHLEVMRLTENEAQIFPNVYHFQSPLSPHAAARLENGVIDTAKIIWPKTEKPLIIELAGGVHTPLNDELTQLEFYSKSQSTWVIVCRHYLGSINHSLLTFHALKNAGVNIAGFVFCGEENYESESYLLKKTKLPVLLKIPFLEEVVRSTLNPLVEKWQPSLQKALLA